jgi:hypothetical protein
MLTVSVTVNGTAVGASETYNGNSFLNLNYPNTYKHLPISMDCKPYGFLGRAKEDTVAISAEGYTLGYLDGRIFLGLSDLQKGESCQYSDKSAVITKLDKVHTLTESAEILVEQSKIVAQLKDDITSVTNKWGVEIAESGVTVGEEGTRDYLAMYTKLVNILDNVVSSHLNLISWANSHSHPTVGTPTSTYTSPAYFSSGYLTDKIEMKTQS